MAIGMTDTARRGHFAAHVLPAVVYIAALFCVSQMSDPPAPDFGVRWSDKINHVGAFGLMTLLVFRAARWMYPSIPLRSQILRAVAFVATYGVVDEFHQAFVPHRSCDITDWIADVCGALAAAAVIALWLRRTLRA